MLKKSLILIIFVINSIIVLNAQNIIVTTDSLATPEVELGEIIIAASKDNLKLKEMPASVTFLTEKRLEANHILALPDASVVVPNFFMPDYGSKLTSPVYIRGI